MKNLFYILILILIFSCGSEAKTDNNLVKTTSQPTETQQNQTISDTKNILHSSETATKISAKNDLKKEIPTNRNFAEVPTKKISSISTNTSTANLEKNSASTIIKNKAEAKAQIETEKVLAKKMRLEEEMKKVEDAKKTKVMADAKTKVELTKKEPQVESLFESVNTKSAAETGLHDGFDALLKKYVSSSGKVNYAGFKNDESKLDSYLQKLEKANVEKSWGREKELAFWINAYNANTIKLILKNYPVKSIMDLHNGKPWNLKWIKIGQRTLSLNDIENDIIRPKFNEPRIHFAVNCAAKSCPPLLNKAWTEKNLNSNLERQTKSFINNSNYNTLTSGKVEISKIFDWYGKDFGNLIAYLNKYADTKIPSGTSINFKSYDWNLNK
jgi:bisphosphoglycerate-dependent phosphoglycerate mutase